MKLYTEEDIYQAIADARYYQEQIMPSKSIVQKLTPIELPSDKEIVNNACTNPITEDFMNDRQIGFVKGCKWMKDKILNQKK